MNYSKYTAIDFVKDEYFQLWVINPSEENNYFWENWLKQHPEKRPVVEEAIEIIKELKLSKNHTSNQDFIQVWQNIYVTTNIKNVERPKVKPNTIYLKYAAIIALLMATIFVLYTLMPESKIIYQAENEQKEIELTDGSKVLLNEKSSMEFRVDENNNRHAWLNGEAFFEINHIQNSQFIVHTEMADVVVVGTSFNVNTTEEKTQVVLSEGKILVNQNNKQLEMNPGEFLEIDQKSQVNTKKVNTDLYTSWRVAAINFDKIPLGQIASWIEDRYEKQIFIENEELKNITFSGTIPTKSLEIILQAIEISYDVKIEKIEDKIFIDNQEI